MNEKIKELINSIETIEKYTTEKITFSVGTYTGKYLIDGEKNLWCSITGNLYIRANYDTLFQVIDVDKRIIDCFDIIEDNAKIQFNSN